MRSPAYSTGGARRAEPKPVDNDFYQYLAPESFTVLPAEDQPVPPAEPYKLTPSRKRHKNQAFSIIAEPTSQTSSRSTSPVGRVSPFRGRGFNPAGSRHASPERSLPSHEAPNSKPRTSSNRVSYIPKPIRRGSSAEDLLSPDASPSGRAGARRGSNLTGNKYSSRSMSNIAPRHLVTKPPPSPRRASHLKTSFVRLSPIIGSSPGSASDQTVSSPSRIPRSKSQPPSRIMSPNPATMGGAATRGLSRPTSRPSSRPASRSNSRSNSPSKASPSKIPLKSSSYKHIPAKVDSFHRVAAGAAAKPKVPVKPKVYSTRPTNSDRTKASILKKTSKSQAATGGASKRDVDDTETTDTDRDTTFRGAGRGASNSQYFSKISSSRTQEKGSYAAKRKDVRGARGVGTDKIPTKSGEKGSSSRYASKESLHFEQNSATEETEDTNYSKESYAESRYVNGDRSGSLHRARPETSRPGANGSSQRRDDKNGAKMTSSTRVQDTTTTVSTTEEASRTEDDTTEDGHDDDILSVTIDSLGPSTTQIVSATTETVTKPLNIEARLLKPSELSDSHAASLDNANAQKATVTANNTGAAANLNVSPNITNTKNSNLVGGGGGGGVTPANASAAHTPTGTTSATATGTATSAAKVTANEREAASNESSAVNNRHAADGGINNANVKRVSHADAQNLNNLEMNVRNSLNSLTPPDSDKVSKSLLDSPLLSNAPSAKLRQARTVIVDEIKPLKITVREKTGDMEVQSGNLALPRSATNGLAERPLVPPNNAQNNVSEQQSVEPKKPGPCARFLGCCKKSKDSNAEEPIIRDQEAQHTDESAKPSIWSKLRCKRNKVTDTSKPTGCFHKFKRNKPTEENWAERRDSILSEPPKQQGCCGRLNRLFCVSCCAKCRRKPAAESESRRTSMMSKKKSLSSTMQPPPSEDTRSKINESLVEYNSHMRGAIPVLPVPLAWICLICNIFLPGFGTILSGLLCLCIGKPRFSPKDGIKPRIGAFLIDVIVGISQMFTVLFCLVGWGWSIWWGVIMLKIARKHKKIKLAERNQIEEQPAPNANHLSRDVERAS